MVKSTIKMNGGSEVVTLSVVKELLATQERSFRQMIELMTNTIKEDINNIRKTVDDLKVSLNFSQKDIDDIKYKLHITEEKVWDAENAIYGNQSVIDKLFDQNEQLENHSRRNIVKVIGIPEKDPNESWEESENLVKML